MTGIEEGGSQACLAAFLPAGRHDGDSHRIRALAIMTGAVIFFPQLWFNKDRHRYF
ncbi:hypothetical protein [Arthrobacter sp. Rue61a]|uniref:hypothetical protein n=1 Tax=Arthrobacter sp. Rue61a TaxID=1118963 RepID=UPI0002D99511|nr:hypothetical protein [Arthrobacter sp. Rue61a]